MSHTPVQKLFGKLLERLIKDGLESGGMNLAEIQEVIRAVDTCLTLTRTIPAKLIPGIAPLADVEEK